MELVAIRNAMIWDGSGADPFAGTVLVEEQRITAVMAANEAQVPEGARHIDAAGRFLMPGMIEGHAHPSFLDVARAQTLGETPPEDHAIATLVNAQKLLDAGFTSLCSAASAKVRTHARMRERGIPIVIGGDYGFDVNPQGGNARDLGYFVRHFGFSPPQALQAATRVGGDIMLMGHELGQIKAGYLADLLLVDADPLADVSVLEDRSNLAMIMIGGSLRKLSL